MTTIFRPIDGDPPYWLVFVFKGPVAGRKSWHQTRPGYQPYRFTSKEAAYQWACRLLGHAAVRAAKVIEYPSENVVHKLTGGKPDGKQLYPSKS